MKSVIKKIMPVKIKNLLLMLYQRINLMKLQYIDNKRFRASYAANKNEYSYEQIVARITKTYHSIEKGLSYENTRLGFGKNQINSLLNLLDMYKKSDYPENDLTYLTAINNLYKYIKFHEDNNYDVSILKKRILDLSINPKCNLGGPHIFKSEDILSEVNSNFFKFSNSRHSVRTYSKEPVDIHLIEKAITLAQNTPSSCNRQPWITRIVSNKDLKSKLINNQYGNRGFGELVDSFVIITIDCQYYDVTIERSQSYVDGGIYAMNLLYSLHYYGLATCPLSTSLTLKQEKNIRNYFNISSSENLILIIAVGNYKENYKVPKSTRKSPKIIYYN